MNIVVEGADASGKSTLARIIAETLHRPIFHSNGPSKYPGEVNERARHFLSQRDAVFDRHPCVGEPVYCILRGGKSELDLDLEENFYTSPHLIIYCRGQRGPHVVKEGEDPAHVRNVATNHNLILQRYDEWALSHAHLMCRCDEDTEFILSVLKTFDPFRDLIEFHSNFQQLYLGKPRALPPDLQRFRNDFLDEELKEYKDAVYALRTELDVDLHSSVASHLEEALDALVDLVYVAIGTAVLHGFNFREAWRRVHAANMRKEVVKNPEDSLRRSRFDIIKPPGWEKPRHRDLVEDHAHKGEFSRR